MKLVTTTIAAILLLSNSHLVPLAASAPTPAADPPPAPTTEKRYSVASVTFNWFDRSRHRSVPAKIYYPGGHGPFPVIVFSHGLGGSRHWYAYLGRHWARHGYVSVHVQHLGSDEAVWRGKLRLRRALRRSYNNLANWRNRPQDVSFAIDRLTRLHAGETSLGKRLDLTRIGVAGHAFGAQTALSVAGQRLPGRNGRPMTLADPRVKAVIAMSPSAPFGQSSLAKTFGKVEVPCLHMTGTEDDSSVSSTRASQRRLPFDSINGVDGYLITFRGGDHMTFCGHILKRLRGRSDPRFQRLIRLSSTAFWDAYLKKDPRARTRLASGGMAASLGRSATFERKLPTGGYARGRRREEALPVNPARRPQRTPTRPAGPPPGVEVETSGLEPPTPGLQSPCSPN